MPLIEVSADYGYVVLAATSTFVMGIVHGLNDGKYKMTGVAHPLPFPTAQQIAESKEHLAYASAQRAHANYLENQPTALAAMMISGLAFPRTTAALGAAWTVSRYFYMTGYCDTSKPKATGRLPGFYVSFLTTLGLIGMAGYTGLKLTGLLDM